MSMVFKPAARYPADPRAVFVLALSVFSGLVALTLNVAPESLEHLLPTWGLVTWGAMLTLGSGVTLIGVAFQSVNGIITEQIGTVMVAAATIFYSLVVFWVVGPSAIQSVGIILAWGLACALRWFQLQALLNATHLRAAKQAVLARVDAEIDARVARELERRAKRPGSLT